MPLEHIIQKDPLITTPSAQDIADSPESWEARFKFHVSTYFAIPEVERKWERILKNLLNGQSATGLIYADTGYGKTSTGASLWNLAEEENIVTVPPFIWNSLADMLTATHSWVSYRLQQTRPELIPDLQQKHQAVVAVDEELLAQQMVNEDKLTLNQAQRTIARLKSEGRLLDALSPRQLLTYLRSATEILLDSGYKGLLILPDEFELFRKNPDTAQNFDQLKNFIFGVHGERDLPIGCVALTYRQTFADIDLRAPHILARFNKPEGSLIDLERFYGHTEFAKSLWNNLAFSCSLSDSENKAIDESVLDALGQFLRHTRSRELMSGPRSVVATFNRAARHATENNRSYSLFDFCEDYLSGHISFSGQHTAAGQLHTQIMALSLINNEARRNMVKLLCVHPEGVPSELLQEQGIPDSDRQTVIDSLLGQHVVRKATGPTLMCYAEGDGLDPLAEILKQLKVQFNPANPEFHRSAVRAFENHVFPEIFTKKSGRDGWTEEAGNNWGVYCSKNLRGSVLRDYPERTLTVDFGTEILSDPTLSAGQFFNRFIFDTAADSDNTCSIAVNGIELHFNIQRSIDSQKIPEDINYLGVLFSPEEITPLCLLSILDFFDQDEIISRLEQEGVRTEVDLRKTQILGTLINYFFSPAMKENVIFAASELADDFRSLPAGKDFVEGALRILIPKRFPGYSAIAVSNGWQRYLENYREALGRETTLSKKRGIEPIESINREVPKIFNVGQMTAMQNFHNGAGRHLLKIDELDDSGNAVVKGIEPRNNNKPVSVYLTPHPLEKHFAELLEESPDTITIGEQKFSAVELPTIYKQADEFGYLDEEIDALINILKARGTADTHESSGMQYLYRMRSGRPFRYLEDRLKNLEKVLFLAEPKGFKPQSLDLSSIRSLIKFPGIEDDEVRKDKLEKDLDVTENNLESQCKEWLAEERSIFQKKIDTLDEIRRNIPQIQEPPTGQRIADFSPILFQRIRPDVLSVCTKLSWEIQAVKDKVTNVLRQSREMDSSLQNVETAIELRMEGSKIDADLKRFTQARDEAQELSHLFDRWALLAKRIADIRVLMTDIPDNQAVRDLIVQVDSVQRKIKAHLGTDDLIPSDVLSSHEHFRLQVEKIGDDFDELKGEIGKKFNNFKGQIERELAKVIDTPYINVVFNPADSDGSYRSIREKVIDMLDQQVIDKSRDRINDLKGELMRPIKVFNPPEPVKVEATELSKEIGDIEAEIDGIYFDLTSENVDLKLPEWVDTLVAIREKGQSIYNRWKEIEHKLVKPRDELTLDAQKLLVALTPQEINFTELIIRLINDGSFSSTREILECLEELYQGNWVNLIVRGK